MLFIWLTCRSTSSRAPSCARRSHCSSRCQNPPAGPTRGGRTSAQMLAALWSDPAAWVMCVCVNQKRKIHIGWRYPGGHAELCMTDSQYWGTRMTICDGTQLMLDYLVALCNPKTMIHRFTQIRTGWSGWQQYKTVLNVIILVKFTV